MFIAYSVVRSQKATKEQEKAFDELKRSITVRDFSEKISSGVIPSKFTEGDKFANFKFGFSKATEALESDALLDFACIFKWLDDNTKYPAPESQRSSVKDIYKKFIDKSGEILTSKPTSDSLNLYKNLCSYIQEKDCEQLWKKYQEVCSYTSYASAIESNIIPYNAFDCDFAIKKANEALEAKSSEAFLTIQKYVEEWIEFGLHYEDREKWNLAFPDMQDKFQSFCEHTYATQNLLIDDTEMSEINESGYTFLECTKCGNVKQSPDNTGYIIKDYLDETIEKGEITFEIKGERFVAGTWELLPIAWGKRTMFFAKVTKANIAKGIKKGEVMLCSEPSFNIIKSEDFPSGGRIYYSLLQGDRCLASGDVTERGNTARTLISVGDLKPGKKLSMKLEVFCDSEYEMED